MPKQEQIIPTFSSEGFTCPHCNFNARQDWQPNVYFSAYGVDSMTVYVARCQKCNNLSIWYLQKMIYPNLIRVSEPNDDMPAEVKADYLEAASILNKSPRAAAALLRLAIQKLCNDIGKTGNINSMIGELVTEGLNPLVQKALDTVRVIGNEAVHPGQIDLKDNQETVVELFKLLNFICDKMITEPKYINDNFNSLPQNKLDQIENRDNINL